jgi:hypothetical protein
LRSWDGRYATACRSPADQTLLSGIDAAPQGLVAAGADAFDGNDVPTLLFAAADVVNALRRVPCQTS